MKAVTYNKRRHLHVEYTDGGVMYVDILVDEKCELAPYLAVWLTNTETGAMKVLEVKEI